MSSPNLIQTNRPSKSLIELNNLIIIFHVLADLRDAPRFPTLVYAFDSKVLRYRRFACFRNFVE